MPHFNTDINVEGLLAFSALAFGFWRAHRANIDRMDKTRAVQSERLARIEEKVGLVYDWMKHKVFGAGG